MAMVELANHDNSSKEPISLTVLAKKEELPLAYLEQLFSMLKKKNLVQSQRGATGGYVLGSKASAISILDIIQAVDRPVKVTRCMTKEGACQKNGPCTAHALWDELGFVIQNFLKTVTLEDVALKKVAGMGRFLTVKAPKEGEKYAPLR